MEAFKGTKEAFRLRRLAWTSDVKTALQIFSSLHSTVADAAGLSTRKYANIPFQWALALP